MFKDWREGRFLFTYIPTDRLSLVNESSEEGKGLYPVTLKLLLLNAASESSLPALSMMQP